MKSCFIDRGNFSLYFSEAFWGEKVSKVLEGPMPERRRIERTHRQREKDNILQLLSFDSFLGSLSCQEIQHNSFKLIRHSKTFL